MFSTVSMLETKKRMLMKQTYTKGYMSRDPLVMFDISSLSSSVTDDKFKPTNRKWAFLSNEIVSLMLADTSRDPLPEVVGTNELQ